jgi:hypothetical protein
MSTFWVPAILLLLIWALIILIVNPVGEFMINDDWSFVKSLEAFRTEGKVIATGWGPSWAPGGPSLLFHLLWGNFFSYLFGYSLTTLRISVLTLGILGSFGLLWLFRFAGVSPWLSLLGTLTVVFNPLFLAESFTYMTDVTFASLAIFALLFLSLGVEKSRLSLIIIGLVFALCSILTRQIGVVIPMALVAACLVHPQGLKLGKVKILFLVMGVVLIPWVAYEVFLYFAGSTPVTQHQVIHKIVRAPLEKGFIDYLGFLAYNLLFCAVGYIAFFISPVLAVRYASFLSLKSFRYFLGILATSFVIFEAAILAGFINPPMVLSGNVIFNLGIGPILLKDTYILFMQRTIAITPAVYYLLFWWAILAMGVLLSLVFSSLRSLLPFGSSRERPPLSFPAALSLLAALFYLGIITLTGLHDRYLIPVFIFVVIWLVLDTAAARDSIRKSWRIWPGLVPLVIFAFFSPLAIHDFMEMKHHLQKAQNYLVQELKVEPCHIDGGFEFNGYHCYQRDFRPRAGLSWWWVSREDYLITLGPLSGYRTILTFPFKRYLSGEGAVCVLQPES